MSGNRRPGPDPKGPLRNKKTAFTTRLTCSTRAALDLCAAANDRSLSQQTELLLMFALNKGGWLSDEDFVGVNHDPR